MVAYDYPLLGIFWTFMMFFLFFAWIVLLFRVLADIFRADEMGGWAKAIWCIVVIVLPLIGVAIYLIANADGMSRRNRRAAHDSDEAFQELVRTRTAARSTASGADELSRLAALRDQGVLTDAEFEQQKARLLA